jgi:hypothetical protein
VPRFAFVPAAIAALAELFSGSNAPLFYQFDVLAKDVKYCLDSLSRTAGKGGVG